MSYDIPKDPHMLASYVNMMLRDRYATLTELCEDNGADPDDILEKLESAGYEFIETINQFR
ncbi:MAG: DUF4250 domain-containing protein [Mogibacterium sp.]|nr:DUF4250 domain-containing protein [Mogibacterium sp.]